LAIVELSNEHGPACVGFMHVGLIV